MSIIALSPRSNSSHPVRRAAATTMETLEGRCLLSVSLGASAGASAVLAPTPPIIVPIANPITGLTFTATAGVPFSGTLALWTKGGVSPVSPVTPVAKAISPITTLQPRASIQWGDDTSSAGTIVFDANGVGHVNGTHTYATPATYKTTITITEAPVGPVPLPQFILYVGSGNGKAIVTAKVAGTGVTFYPAVGKSFTGVVAHLGFTVPAVQSGPGIYTASVNWGDKNTSTGKFVSASTAGRSDVVGTHTYAKTGEYKVVVTVTYAPSATAAAVVLATVDSTAIVGQFSPVGIGKGVTLNLTAGKSFTGSVGSFLYPGTGAAPSDLLATVYWGDGTSGKASLVRNKTGGFDVDGTHAYAKPGVYVISVDVELTPVVAPVATPPLADIVARFDSIANVVVPPLV